MGIEAKEARHPAARAIRMLCGVITDHMKPEKCRTEGVGDIRSRLEQRLPDSVVDAMGRDASLRQIRLHCIDCQRCVIGKADAAALAALR